MSSVFESLFFFLSHKGSKIKMSHHPLSIYYIQGKVYSPSPLPGGRAQVAGMEGMGGSLHAWEAAEGFMPAPQSSVLSQQQQQLEEVRRKQKSFKKEVIEKHAYEDGEHAIPTHPCIGDVSSWSIC